MALIKCPNCGKDISDKATKCIHCKLEIKSDYSQVDNNVNNQNGMKDNRIGKSGCSIALIVLIILFLIFGLSMCSGSGSGSSSKDVYYCGFCGKKMTGGYYDYFDNKYVCRSCSKKYRER